MKKRSTVFFILSVLIIGFVAYVGAAGLTIGAYEVKPFSKTINRGLDLQGGVSLVEEIQSSSKVNADTINRTVELLNMRVNKMGVSETTVAREGENKIRIEVPGKFDPTEIENTIGKTGKLTFVGPDNKVILTGDDVKSASAYIDSQMNQPTISLALKDSGTKKFADATTKFVGQNIKIYMDEDLLEDATVNEAIVGGNAVITGSKTLSEAQSKANIINSGALPVTLKVASASTVGATLGATALPLSVKAGVVAIAIILCLMFIWYRRPGLMADIGLILYIFLVLLVFTGIDATLTLSGIAAFLLTVGMAVDANVLIFARIKEELKAGKSVRSATEAGFHRALPSILDSNINTIIAGIVLYLLGSGAVKGFALTLVIGVLVSLFTALVVTKHLLYWAMDMKLISDPKHFGVKRG
ncbi:MAG: protein translocase subunit SecD [Bacillota bacterium]|nr:protein translocase subunit SecD [Bacillota bacterium]